MSSTHRQNRPKAQSLVLAALCAVAAHFAAAASPRVGYALALMIMILIGIQGVSRLAIWPTKSEPETPIIFAVYWGLIAGMIVPQLFTAFAEHGVGGLVEFLGVP